MRLENSFDVDAPPAAAWELLNDVPRVVPCMPGAELKEVVDDNTWKAVMHVKLGPISLQFGTDVVREESDHAGRRVVLSAKARELKGRGGAQAKIESTLLDRDGGGTTVNIGTDLTLQGTVAQYGRGIVADVAGALTKQFADCIAQQLAAGSTVAPDAGGDLAADAGSGSAPAGGAAPAALPPQPVKPVGGLGLGLKAILNQFLRLFRRN